MNGRPLASDLWPWRVKTFDGQDHCEHGERLTAEEPPPASVGTDDREFAAVVLERGLSAFAFHRVFVVRPHEADIRTRALQMGPLHLSRFVFSFFASRFRRRAPAGSCRRD